MKSLYFLLFVTIYFVACSSSMKLVPTPTFISETSISPTSTTSLTSDFVTCEGDTMWRSDQPGPWRMRLMIAYSDDSLTFTHTNQILINQADVPDAITTQQGEIRVYFIAFCPEMVRNKLVVAISQNATQWVYKKVNILKNNFPFTVDPTVELTSDGRYRLYFSSAVINQDGSKDDMRTYSAISPDGITFTLEEGVRFSVEGQDVLDPNVLLIGDTWQYFAGGSPEWNYHATSLDGLHFTRQEDFMYESIMMANGVAVQGGYRYYGFVQNQGPWFIRSLFTQDGLAWSVDAGNRLELDPSSGLEAGGVKDPTVTPLLDGRYMMVYSTYIPEFFTPPHP